MVNSSIVSAFVDAVIGKISGLINSHNTSNSAHTSLFDDKQDELVSGSNIKTINNQSLLGSGNISISGGGGSYINDYYWDSTNKKIVLDYSNGVTNADIVTDWSSPLSDERVPSEKLVKNALDSISGGGGGSSVTVDSTWVSNSTNPVQSQLIKSALDGKSDTGHTHSQYLTEHQSLSNYVTTSDSRLSDARTPTSHTHGNLSNDGKLGSTSGKPVITGSSGSITTGSFGSTSGTFAEGNHTHSGFASSSHNHDLTDLNNMEAVQVTITYTNNSTENIKLVKYTGS